MILGIDGSNIKSGGGLVHLKSLLEFSNPLSYGFKKVVIWGGRQLDQIEERVWLEKRKPDLLIKGGFINETRWKLYHFEKEALKHCDFVFAPGGTFYSNKIAYVSMSQNMLVFDSTERNRYFFSLDWIRLLILNRIQSKSLKNAKANIFISNFAKETISGKLNLPQNMLSSVIYHGITDKFRESPSLVKNISEYSKSNPFKILYVSIVDVYKHQWILAEAVSRIRKLHKLPVELILVGGAYIPALKKLEKVIKSEDPNSEFLHYLGKVEHHKLVEIYKKADLFAFSSTCENMPNIVIEAMSSGLPIVSGDYSPMKEVLGKCGKFYNPTSVDSTYVALLTMIENKKVRAEMAQCAYLNSQEFSWTKCADKTFSFLSNVGNKISKKKKQ